MHPFAVFLFEPFCYPINVLRLNDVFELSDGYFIDTQQTLQFGRLKFLEGQIVNHKD
jgi:hypothetical protein